MNANIQGWKHSTDNRDHIQSRNFKCLYCLTFELWQMCFPKLIFEKKKVFFNGKMLVGFQIIFAQDNFITHTQQNE